MMATRGVHRHEDEGIDDGERSLLLYKDWSSHEFTFSMMQALEAAYDALLAFDFMHCSLFPAGLATYFLGRR